MGIKLIIPIIRKERIIINEGIIIIIRKEGIIIMIKKGIKSIIINKE